MRAAANSSGGMKRYISRVKEMRGRKRESEEAGVLKKVQGVQEARHLE